MFWYKTANYQSHYEKYLADEIEQVIMEKIANG